MIISLTGFMGCGKSSVGRELSKSLSRPALDLDDEIERRAGRSVPEIFRTDGEAAFRAMEAETLRDVIARHASEPCGSDKGRPALPTGDGKGAGDSCGSDVSLILSLGGGTLMTPECAEIVRNRTLCVYLRAGIDCLVENLEIDGGDRPMLYGREPLRDKVERLMALRSRVYEETAALILDIDGLSPAEIASALISSVSQSPVSRRCGE